MGIVLVEDLMADPEVRGLWRNGNIYDPANGRSYSAEARLDGPDRLLLRGYLGIPLFGRAAASSGKCAGSRAHRPSVRGQETSRSS